MFKLKTITTKRRYDKMDYYISKRISSLKPSAIREIFKYATDSSVISMAGGDPSLETLPVDIMKQYATQAFEENPRLALLYSQSEGHPPLRQALREYLTKTGVAAFENNDVMVTTGAQQAMDLTCKVLCEEGDSVICESPSFIGTLNCFRSYRLNLIGVKMQSDGMDLNELEQALKNNPNTRFIYTIPNFQNPTGFTTSMEKRTGIYNLAKKYNVLVLEDNPYGDLRFEGEAIPPIKSLDTDGRVIYVGSFSKILSTGMRVGYVVVDKNIFGRYVVAKQCTDVHTSIVPQLICYKFLTKSDINAHINGCKKVYAHKCNLALEQMDKLFPKAVTHSKPSGGIFVWVDLPDYINGNDFATQLVKEYKVCVVPGSAFMINPEEISCAFRLNYTASSEDKILVGIEKCAQLLNKLVK